MVKALDSSWKVASSSPISSRKVFRFMVCTQNNSPETEEFSKEFTQLCPEKMSRCLPPHPDGCMGCKSGGPGGSDSTSFQLTSDPR